MNKDKIKSLVRESLLREKGRVETEKKDSEGGNSEKDARKEKAIKKDYTDIQNALDTDKNPTAPSQVGIMKSMGISDDEKGVNRSLFGKKLHQEKNDEGGLYQFNDDELAKIRGILQIS